MKLLVVDGNSILNRAYYGIRPLTTKDGQFTHAIYGFLTMLLKIKNDTLPDAVAIAFDLKAPTFRHKAYAGYKAQRKGMPPELACQLQPLKDLLTALGYKLVTCEGYEADDILGTLAKTCEKNGDECVIATGDRDSLQLVSDKVNVRLAATKQGSAVATLYDTQKVIEDYGVEPLKLIDIKALWGDTSDNIPGVAGIGQKGATDLIKKFGSVDYIYEHIDSIDIKDGVRKKLLASKDNAFLSKMLGEIYCEVPIDTDINHYVVSNRDTAAASRMIARLELFSLVDKLGLNEADVQTEPQKNDKKIFSLLHDNDYKSLLCGDKAYFDFKFDGKSATLIISNGENVLIIDDVKKIEEFFSDDGIKKFAYSSKEAFAFCDKRNIELKNICFDICLASYLLNPSASGYELERLCAEYEYTIPIAENEDDKDYGMYTALESLCNILLEKIKENEQEKLLFEIEIPLARVLARMENIGFEVDKSGIEEYSKVIGDKVCEIEQEIYSLVGYEFNINSPKQLGVALFEKLGLPAKKKTKSGYSTNAQVLDELKNYHPVISLILNYRTLAKLKSTYCDGLLKVIGEDGRIHSSFNQTETRTGRISSTEPNLQNIPVRTELGRELRKFFCAKYGDVLVDADYSQIELRVLADVANDKNMIEAFNNNDDIHAITASQVFNIPLEMVTSVMRSRAKAVNFGIVYGIGAFSLAKDIGVMHKEASNYIKAYLNHYSGVDNYMKTVIEKAKNDGYVQTLFGRRRYLPELTASNHMTRAFGERVARNMPIQGTAADIIKIAMVQVDKRLSEEKLKARLILQVHDELIVEAPENEASLAAKILKEEMENAVKLSVPLTADHGVGKTWYDAKG